MFSLWQYPWLIGHPQLAIALLHLRAMTLTLMAAPEPRSVSGRVSRCCNVSCHVQHVSCVIHYVLSKMFNGEITLSSVSFALIIYNAFCRGHCRKRLSKITR